MSTTALPSQSTDFPAWYGEVVRRAGLAENSPVRGAMVIKPYGHAIWEAIQRELDDRIKATGHENVYLPLFVPAGASGVTPRSARPPSVSWNPTPLHFPPSGGSRRADRARRGRFPRPPRAGQIRACRRP